MGLVSASPLWASPASLLNVFKGAAAITVGDAPASLEAPFKLAATGSVDIAGTDITVRFVNVTEDSRCPSDVTCVWAGQVSVMLSLIQDSDTDLGSFVLTLGAGSNSSMAEHKVGDYVIKLLEVEPYPVSTHQIQLSEYIATLVLSKADGNSTGSRSVLVMALGTNTIQSHALTKFIAGWSIARGNGLAIFVLADNSNGKLLLGRSVATFIPFEAQCSHGAGMAYCVDGQITSISGNSGMREGDIIHLEVDGSKTKAYVLFRTPLFVGPAGAVEQSLDIHKIQEVGEPTVPTQDGNSTIVTLTEGQREGPLLVQKIYPDRVEGLNFPEYPIAMDQGLPITLHVGEKASNGCTVFLTLIRINDGSATFSKQVDESRPCPICWYQKELMSGWK